jgi:hypothetical protein
LLSRRNGGLIGSLFRISDSFFAIMIIAAIKSYQKVIGLLSEKLTQNKS